MSTLIKVTPCLEVNMPNYVLTFFVHKSVFPQSMKLLTQRHGIFTTSYEVSPLDDGYIGILCTFQYIEDLNRFLMEAYKAYGVYFYILSLIGGPERDYHTVTIYRFE